MFTISLTTSNTAESQACSSASSTSSPRISSLEGISVRSLLVFHFHRSVIVDSESALSASPVRERLRKIGVDIEVFPKGLGHLMDPVELFINDCKKRYYNTLASRESASPLRLAEQVSAISKAYYEVEETSIAHFVFRCGYRGRESAKEVMRDLLFEGARPRPQFQEQHKAQLNAYLEAKEVFGF